MRTDAERKRRLLIFGGVLLLLVVAVAIVIALTSGGSGSSSSTSVKASSAVKREFTGLPQTINELGSPKAKATLMVFADMQSPFCRQFWLGAFPQIVKRYVKTGKLKVVFQPISILGPDSLVAARAVAAAAPQNKMFDYATVLYDNQREKNTGYVTERFLTKVAQVTPRLEVAKWKADLGSEAGALILSRAQTAARSARVGSTPTFMVARAGQMLEQFRPDGLTAHAFYGTLGKLTR